MIEFETGTIPSRSLTFLVRDELDNPINIVGYDNLRLEMLGQDGEPVDLSGSVIREILDVIGGFTVTLPKTRSLFNERGIYTLRLVLENVEGTRDITRTAEIKVRDFGRIK